MAEETDDKTELTPEYLARLLIEKHKRRALQVAATRTRKLAEDNDEEGARQWFGIMELVRKFEKTTNKGP